MLRALVSFMGLPSSTHCLHLWDGYCNEEEWRMPICFQGEA